MSTPQPTRPSLLKPRAYWRWWLAEARQGWHDSWAEYQTAKAEHHRVRTITRTAETKAKHTTDPDQRLHILEQAQREIRHP